MFERGEIMAGPVLDHLEDMLGTFSDEGPYFLGLISGVRTCTHAHSHPTHAQMHNPTHAGGVHLWDCMYGSVCIYTQTTMCGECTCTHAQSHTCTWCACMWAHSGQERHISESVWHVQVDFAYIPFLERYQLLLPEFFGYDLFEGRPRLLKLFEVRAAVFYFLSPGVIMNNPSIGKVSSCMGVELGLKFGVLFPFSEV